MAIVSSCVYVLGLIVQVSAFSYIIFNEWEIVIQLENYDKITLKMLTCYIGPHISLVLAAHMAYKGDWFVAS